MSWKACAAVKELRVGLDSMEKFVLLVLAEYHRTDGKNEWPSMSTLAEDCLLSERGVRQIVSRLEENGFLRRSLGGGRGKLNSYKIVGVDFKKGEPETGNQETLNDETVNETLHQTAENPAQPCNPPITPYKELPVKNIPDLTLSPPSSEQKETRFAIFKDLLFRFYNWKYERDPQWDGSEAKQLHSLLKSDPKLDAKTFAQWLKNYGESKDICPGERPRIFLPRLSRYSVTALNQYGRSVDVENEARGSVGQRNDDAFARVNRQVPKPNSAAFNPRISRSGNRGLESTAEILQLPGD